MDILVLAGDMNAQVGKITSVDMHLSGRFELSAQPTDNEDQMLHFCSNHQLFVMKKKSSQNKQAHQLTRRRSTAHQSCTQMDHIAMNFYWRASIQVCRSV